jgi:serine protease Do
MLRDRQTRDVSLTLAKLEEKQDPGETEEIGSSGDRGSHAPSLGVGVGDEDGKVVVESVRRDGPSDGKLRPGDVIEEVDHQPVRSASDLSAKVQASAARKPLLLRVRRGDSSRYVAIERSAS